MKKYIAELLGTYILVFVGTGAAVVNEVTNGSITHMGVSLTFGLLVMILIYAFGETSGAHLNPAVSIAFVLAGRFPAKEILPYAISQLVGALLASLTLKLLFPSNVLLGSTVPAGSAAQSFVLELLLTFMLMLIIFQVATGNKEKGTIAGVTIGSVIFLEALFAGPISGASMNPVRSLAPALVSGHLGNLWIYLTAPVLGAGLAVPVWRLIR